MNHAFVSGEPSLDFVGTLKWRRDEQEELLRRPADLSTWALEGAIVSEGFEISPADFGEALRLREVIYSAVHSVMADEPIADDRIDLLNRFASAPPVQPRLAGMKLHLAGDCSAVLSTIARNAVAVVLDPSMVLKECASEKCTRIFVDRSRGTRRSWCGMDECGNRVKAAAYRRRLRGEEPASALGPTPAFTPSCIVG